MHTPTRSARATRATVFASFLVGALTLAALPASAQSNGDAGTADLVMDKQEHADPVDQGAIVSFGLNVTNLGPDTATGITIVDEAPVGFEFAGGAPRCSEGAAPNVVVCDAEDLPANASLSYLVSFRATVSGTFTDRAEVTADQADPNAANNADEEDTTVLSLEARLPPGATESLTCVAEAEGVRVRWTPVDGVSGPSSGYHVDRREAGEPEFTRIVTTNASSSSILDEDVTPGIAYDYQVIAFNEHGTGPAVTCTVTAIPFFPGAMGALLATLAGVGAVGLTRRRAA